MNDGRPAALGIVFSQSPEETEETTVPVVEREPVDRVGNQLRFSSNYGDAPMFEGQAKVYPDSVKVVAVRYRSFDVANESDMLEYSKICMSSLTYGKFMITSDEVRQWNEQKGTWLILLRYQERMFKTFSTVDQDPTEQ